MLSSLFLTASLLSSPSPAIAATPPTPGDLLPSTSRMEEELIRELEGPPVPRQPREYRPWVALAGGMAGSMVAGYGSLALISNSHMSGATPYTLVPVAMIGGAMGGVALGSDTKAWKSGIGAGLGMLGGGVIVLFATAPCVGRGDGPAMCQGEGLAYGLLAMELAAPGIGAFLASHRDQNKRLHAGPTLLEHEGRTVPGFGLSGSW